MKEFPVDNPSDFQVEKNKDLEHDVYTLECKTCRKEFSVFVPNKHKATNKISVEELKKILASKQCSNCRK